MRDHRRGLFARSRMLGLHSKSNAFLAYMPRLSITPNDLVSLCVCALFIVGPQAALAAEGRLSFQQIISKAKKIADQPYEDSASAKVTEALKTIGYDQWRDIRFKNEATLWGGTPVPFKVRFFLPGFVYRTPVKIHYVDRQGVRPVEFSPGMFDYGKTGIGEKVPKDLGFAGFRMHYPINTPTYDDEIGVFLGASYFRAVAKGQFYGMSARGLAIDTATQNGEEFPFFKEFWILKPKESDTAIIVYALLDSPSVAGAYQYVINPGPATVMQVRSVLFTRKRIEKLGIAPLTSMFYFDDRMSDRDFRPEVHDSDGLQVLTRSGEWIWRPLVNPKELLVNTFEVGTPKGFGILQRDQNFDHYQDLESRFEARPSVWVTPKKDWGPGRVELIQIPTPNEYNDNIGAYWVPDKPPEAGQRLDFSYTLEWTYAAAKRPSLGYVVDTRHERHEGDTTRFVVDFRGDEIEALPPESVLTAAINIDKGYTILDRQVFKNPVTSGWRMVFRIQFDREGPFKDMFRDKPPTVGIRAYLNAGSRAVTETWDYVFVP